MICSQSSSVAHVLGIGIALASPSRAAASLVKKTVSVNVPSSSIAKVRR